MANEPPPGDEIELDEEDERILDEVWAIPLSALSAQRYSERTDPLGLGSDWALEPDPSRPVHAEGAAQSRRRARLRR
jgi:hypothetical protein